MENSRLLSAVDTDICLVWILPLQKVKRADWSTLDFVLNLFSLDITQGRRVKRTGNSASVTPAILFSSAVQRIYNARGACGDPCTISCCFQFTSLLQSVKKCNFCVKFVLLVSWYLSLSLLNQNDKAALGLASASSVSGSVTYYSQYLTWKRKKNRPTNCNLNSWDGLKILIVVFRWHFCKQSGTKINKSVCHLLSVFIKRVYVLRTYVVHTSFGLLTQHLATINITCADLHWRNHRKCGFSQTECRISIADSGIQVHFF